MSKPNFSFLDGESGQPHFDFIYSYLYELLVSLDGVLQSPKYHPERDALYHSLQVFELALKDSNEPILWAAALFHDVGKAIDYPNHDKVGAAALSNILNGEICWLVEHHLDLLKAPAKTRKRFRGSNRGASLEKLRRWDLKGRDTDVNVMTIEDALDILFLYQDKILNINLL